MCIIFGVACGWYNFYGYLVWIAFVVVLAVVAYFEKSNGSKPFRHLIVSATIVMNSTQWISNLFSPVWLLLFPLQLAIYGEMPLAESSERFLTLCFVFVVLFLPPAIITDRLVNICRFLSPKTVVDRHVLLVIYLDNFTII